MHPRWLTWALGSLLALVGSLPGCRRVERTVAPDATMSNPHHLVARRDPALTATVVERMPLRYVGGAVPSEDLPGHVRAGSALGWLGRRLVVVQDDTLALGLVDLSRSHTEPVLLPRGEANRRQFGSALGNKRHKFDLESCIAVRDEHGERLLALGSGSTRARERIVVASPAPSGALTISVLDASRLYAALRARSDFSGSELNIEGAAVVGERVRLFQRGNGAPRPPLVPLDATIDLDLPSLLRFLAAPASAPLPSLDHVTSYDLGTIGGARLTFTDATTATDGRVVYLASAEASPDTYHDGPVTGVALGVLDDAGARWCPVLDASGAPLDAKAEGLAPDPDDATRWYAVTDRDDPDAPAELLTLVVAGR